MNFDIQITRVQLRNLQFLILWALIIISAFLSPVSAQNIPNLPKPTGRVSDFAGVLDLPTKTRLETQISNFRERSSPSVELAVAIVKTTGDRPIFDYSFSLARQWGIGSKDDVNPGALLFIAIDDRKYQTQISRDLEAELPDGVVGSIQRQYLVPQFKAGNYGKGIEDTIAAFIRTIESKRGISGNDGPRLAISLPDFLLLKPDTFVNDFYGILETPAKTVMNRHLEKLRDETSPPSSVYLVIVEATYGVSANDFSLAIADAWKLDLEKEDSRNVLFFISMADRTYFTQVGRGLANELPRSSVERIEKNLLSYAFSPSSGEYNKAISRTVNAFARSINPKMPEVDFTLGNPNGFRGYDSIFHYLADIWPTILILIVLLVIVGTILWLIVESIRNGGGSGGSGGSFFDGSGSSSGSSWTSSDSSDGFGGFGGGGDFGGGGAGGSW